MHVLNNNLESSEPHELPQLLAKSVQREAHDVEVAPCDAPYEGAPDGLDPVPTSFVPKKDTIMRNGTYVLICSPLSQPFGQIMSLQRNWIHVPLVYFRAECSCRISSIVAQDL